MIRATLIAGAASLAMSGASFFVGKARGYSNGVAHERAEQAADRAATQDDLNRLGEKIAAQAGQLLMLERERKSLVADLENQALDAPGSDRPGVAATGGLRRVQQRWGAP